MSTCEARYLHCQGDNEGTASPTIAHKRAKWPWEDFWRVICAAMHTFASVHERARARREILRAIPDGSSTTRRERWVAESNTPRPRTGSPVRYAAYVTRDDTVSSRVTGKMEDGTAKREDVYTHSVRVDVQRLCRYCGEHCLSAETSWRVPCPLTFVDVDGIRRVGETRRVLESFQCATVDVYPVEGFEALHWAALAERPEMVPPTEPEGSEALVEELSGKTRTLRVRDDYAPTPVWRVFECEGFAWLAVPPGTAMPGKPVPCVESVQWDSAWGTAPAGVRTVQRVIAGAETRALTGEARQPKTRTLVGVRENRPARVRRTPLHGDTHPVRCGCPACRNPETPARESPGYVEKTLAAYEGGYRGKR